MDEARARGKKNRSRCMLIGLLVILLALMLACLCVGKYSLGPGECLRILWHSLTQGLADLMGSGAGAPGGGASDAADSGTQAAAGPEGIDPMDVNMLLRVRLPRTCAAVLVGAALALSGSVYQSIFKNPLVSPDFLGVSAGACVGAAIAILMSAAAVMIQISAFLGGVLAVSLTVLIPRMLRSDSNIMLVLAGIIISGAMTSVLGFIKYIADPQTQLAAITYWQLGSFAYVNPQAVISVLPLSAAAGVLLLLLAWWINVLSLGEQEARSLGARVSLLRGLCIVCATVLTAGAVCVAGTIGWIGLVIPHFGRMLVGPDNRVLLPASLLMGGIFMLLVDTVTRIIGPAEMPVSILTGIIGAPVFAWLLYRQRRTLR